MNLDDEFSLITKALTARKVPLTIAIIWLIFTAIRLCLRTVYKKGLLEIDHIVIYNFNDFLFAGLLNRSS